MGWLSRVFGSKKADRYLSDYAADMGVTSTIRKCDRCPESFRLPEFALTLPFELDDSRIDLGGHCTTCGKFSCPRHLTMRRLSPSHCMVVCRECGRPVQGT